MPAADLLVAGVTCTNQQGMSLFDVEDPEWEERATRSERDRATATCVLQYAGKHHPRLILIECTTELQSWGYALPGRRAVGDGSTYRWWLGEFEKLGYRSAPYTALAGISTAGKSAKRCRHLWGTPKNIELRYRDRLYICFWTHEKARMTLQHSPPRATSVRPAWSSCRASARLFAGAADGQAAGRGRAAGGGRRRRAAQHWQASTPHQPRHDPDAEGGGTVRHRAAQRPARPKGEPRLRAGPGALRAPSPKERPAGRAHATGVGAARLHPGRNACG